MGITSGIVLYAVVWFLVLFVVLPLRMQTQGEAGSVVPGTQSSAPANLNMGRKLRTTTIAAAVVWVVLVGIILSGVIEVRDFDVLNRMPPLPE
jgi:predicted secreted protein